MYCVYNTGMPDIKGVYKSFLWYLKIRNVCCCANSVHCFACTVHQCNIVAVCWLTKAARTVGLKHVQCTEDDDFMAAFDKMMSETLQVIHRTWSLFIWRDDVGNTPGNSPYLNLSHLMRWCQKHSRWKTVLLSVLDTWLHWWLEDLKKTQFACIVHVPSLYGRYFWCMQMCRVSAFDLCLSVMF